MLDYFFYLRTTADLGLNFRKEQFREDGNIEWECWATPNEAPLRAIFLALPQGMVQAQYIPPQFWMAVKLEIILKPKWNATPFQIRPPELNMITHKAIPTTKSTANKARSISR